MTTPSAWLPDTLHLGSPAEVPHNNTFTRLNWWLFAAAAFLVSVPVFIQAPLVRSLPWVSLGMTVGWLWLSLRLRS
ncbi:MAG TPA: DUF3120 domain-containing protein, partial [Allocoleopsis sp.]